MEWHHIVEQCQASKSGFPITWINNSNNVVSIPTEIHRQISAYYSSIQDFTDGMIFRNWLIGMDFEEQFRWGVKVLEKFGVNFQ